MSTTLLFELHHLGDAVLSVPFVRAMQDENLHVVCRAGSVPIFRHFLPAEQIHPWEPWWEVPANKKIAAIRSAGPLLQKLRALHAERAFCVWADPRVHALMAASGARERHGFPVNEQNFYAHERPWRRRRMLLGQLIGSLVPLTHPLQRHDYQQAHLADWQQLTEAAGLHWNPTTQWFDVPPHPEVPPSRQKRWLLHPGGRLPTKRWPIDRFQTLLNTTFRDKSALLIQPPDSPGLVSSNPLHHSFAPRDFDELLSLVQSADTVLCNDSLVSHLAAALGKPVWTLFGSGNPNWFAPFGNKHGVIASNICPFRPCIDRCVHPTPICLEAITVETVAAALDHYP